jgi:arylformamidase
MAERPQNLIHDISMPLSRQTPVWPTSEHFAITWLKNHQSDGYSESALSLNAHTGTHVDFPYHFMADGKRGGDVPLDEVVGISFVLDCHDAVIIDRLLLETAQVPPRCTRLLLKTRNSLIKGEAFTEDYVSLAPDGAQWLVERGIRLVGTDYLSIEAFRSECRTHKILLGNGILVLEGLVLAGIPEGNYYLTALPMNIPDAESAPVRAILLEGELN